MSIDPVYSALYAKNPPSTAKWDGENGEVAR